MIMPFVHLKSLLPRRCLLLLGMGCCVASGEAVADEMPDSVALPEVQVTAKRNLPKRSRYYQSMIDLNSISKGAKYNDLRKSYVIFICMFDPFGKDLPIYTFRNKCVEEPKLELGDDTAKVFINPYGNAKRLSAGLKSFFDYLKEEIA